MQDDEWWKINILTKFLKFFVDCKDSLEPSNTPTAQKIIPMFELINYKLDPLNLDTEFLKSAATAFKDKVISKYYDEDKVINDVAKICFFLDPRVPAIAKHKYYNLVLLTLINEYKYVTPTEQNRSASNIVSSSAPTTPQSFSLYNQYKVVQETTLNSSAIITSDVVHLFLEKDHCVEDNKDFDILKWWFHRKNEWPELYILVCDFFSAQATSSCSERAASLGKQVLDGRENLTYENFREEVLLRSWSYLNIDVQKYLPTDYKLVEETEETEEVEVVIIDPVV